MGDVSIMARRLKGGEYVQYGWSGNGGYYKHVGSRLMSWYTEPDMVDYLFGLGQTKLIGMPGSEKGGESWFYSHDLTGEAHWLGRSEREIFSRIAFIDYGYFFDLDDRWYYVIPGPFRIKIPLEYIDEHRDGSGYEFDETNRIERMIAEYILGDYYESEPEFQEYISENCQVPIGAVRDYVLEEKYPLEMLFENYRTIWQYFDDWVVVRTDDQMEKVTGFILRKKQDGDRVETIFWK